MKKWLKNILWLTFAAGLWVLMVCVNTAQEDKIVGLPTLEIELIDDMKFLTAENLMERLKARDLVADSMVYSQADINAVETFIREMPEVKNVQVFTYISGEWVVDVKLREPLVRIFNRDGSSCYLDTDGTLMPLSRNYAAHVITVNGNINETDYTKTVENIINNDSLKTNEILDDLYAISTYVCSDEFSSAQITHIYINEYDEFEFIPRVGDQRIMFGDASHVEGKMKKLEWFYTEGISRSGWSQYDTINIMYKSQVVCSYRN